MAGVVSTLPAALPGGVVIRSGTGAAHLLGLVPGQAAGRPIRSGAASAHALSLTGGVAGGSRRITSPAAGLALPLTVPRGVGLRDRSKVTGPGGAHPLPLTRGVPSARKQVNGHGGSQVLLLAVLPSSGRKTTGGTAYGLGLPLQLRPVGGTHLEHRFDSPTEDELVPLEPLHSHRLIGRVPYALTVWRDANGWHTALHPNPDRLVGADRVYRGGSTFLTDSQRSELVDAGFGDHIALKEIR